MRTQKQPAHAVEPVSARVWLIVGLIFIVALINYFDRQSLSVVAPLVQQRLHLSDNGYGRIVGLFLLASALSYAVSGILSDWMGTRASMALFVAWWSIAEASTAFVSSVFQLGLARFCLGLGEPGLWVAAPKAVREIFDERRRTLAIGIYTLGATAGAVVAIPVISFVISSLPWRSVFLLDGLAGLLWLPLWFLVTRGKLGRTMPGQEASGLQSVRQIITQGKTWRLLLARSITDPVWYFYLFWFPKYLIAVQHQSLAQLAHQGWIVYLAAGIGTLLGGIGAGSMIRRGTLPAHAYRVIMLFAALLVMLSPFVTIASSALVATLVGSVIAFAHMAWLVNLTSMVLTLFPASQVGTATGLVAAGSGLGGMVSSVAVGYVVSHYGYSPLFFVMASLHPLAIALCWSVVRDKQAASYAV